jgi:hypothetical protein
MTHAHLHPTHAPEAVDELVSTDVAVVAAFDVVVVAASVVLVSAATVVVVGLFVAVAEAEAEADVDVTAGLVGVTACVAVASVELAVSLGDVVVPRTVQSM